MEFETVCPVCDNDYKKYKAQCTKCKGIGHVPTDDGERLMEFLRHNNFVRAREE